MLKFLGYRKFFQKICKFYKRVVLEQQKLLQFLQPAKQLHDGTIKLLSGIQANEIGGKG